MEEPAVVGELATEGPAPKAGEEAEAASANTQEGVPPSALLLEDGEPARPEKTPRDKTPRDGDDGKKPKRRRSKDRTSRSSKERTRSKDTADAPEPPPTEELPPDEPWETALDLGLTSEESLALISRNALDVQEKLGSRQAEGWKGDTERQKQLQDDLKAMDGTLSNLVYDLGLWKSKCFPETDSFEPDLMSSALLCDDWWTLRVAQSSKDRRGPGQSSLAQAGQLALAHNVAPVAKTPRGAPQHSYVYEAGDLVATSLDQGYGAPSARSYQAYPARDDRLAAHTQAPRRVSQPDAGQASLYAPPAAKRPPRSRVDSSSSAHRPRPQAKQIRR